MTRYRTIVVVGASAGGTHALIDLVRQIPADFPAALMIVQHTSSSDPSYLPQLLNQASALDVMLAADAMPIRPGQIVVAPPDYHLLLEQGAIRLARGPHENMARPAIDALFRSAAASYASQVIGVLLTGMLNDGTAGLGAIRRCGGLSIVQDPDDAAYPEMPQSALDHGVVDYVVPLSEIATLLDQLVQVPLAAFSEVPDDIRREAEIAARVKSDPATEHQLGALTSLSCPTCGGPLWQIDDPLTRFRCHVGHGFTTNVLLDAQEASVEHALWVALRTLEERARLVSRIGGDGDASTPHPARSARYFERLEELTQATQTLRSLLQRQGWRIHSQPSANTESGG